eukprot:jgi/Botrbrau1/8962/Bobra.0148s0074.1
MSITMPNARPPLPQTALRTLNFVLFSVIFVNGVERTFVINNNVFGKGWQPLQIISGSIHYQRIHPDYWQDRLQRVKALGLNAVQFYIPWNFHERRPGRYKLERLCGRGALHPPLPGGGAPGPVEARPVCMRGVGTLAASPGGWLPHRLVPAASNGGSCGPL